MQYTTTTILPPNLIYPFYFHALVGKDILKIKLDPDSTLIATSKYLQQNNYYSYFVEITADIVESLGRKAAYDFGVYKLSTLVKNIHGVDSLYLHNAYDPGRLFTTLLRKRKLEYYHRLYPHLGINTHQGYPTPYHLIKVAHSSYLPPFYSIQDYKDRIDKCSPTPKRLLTSAS